MKHILNEKYLQDLFTHNMWILKHHTHLQISFLIGREMNDGARKRKEPKSWGFRYQIKSRFQNYSFFASPQSARLESLFWWRGNCSPSDAFSLVCLFLAGVFIRIYKNYKNNWWLDVLYGVLSEVRME